ncbi:MAG: hypothetical protein U1E36_04225 [Rickettsiales bacterium]
MAEPQKSPTGLEIADWTQQMQVIGGQINNKALNLAYELAMHGTTAKFTQDDRNKLVTDMFHEFEKVSKGQQTLDDLNKWLQNNRERFHEAGVYSPVEKPFSEEVLTNYRLLNTRTPTQQQDGTVKQLEVTFPFSMEGQTGFKSLADFKERAGVDAAHIARADRRPTVAPVHTDPDAQPEHTVKQATPDPKEILQWYTFLHDALPKIESVYEKTPKKGANTLNVMTEEQRQGIEQLYQKSTQLMGWLDQNQKGFHLTPEGEKHKEEAIALMKDIRKLAGHNEALTAFSPKMISITGPNEQHPDVEDQRGRPFLPNIQRDALNKMDDFRRELERSSFRGLSPAPGLADPPTPEPAPAQRGDADPVPAPAAPEPERTTISTMGANTPDRSNTGPHRGDWDRLVAGIYPGSLKAVAYAPVPTQQTIGTLAQPRIVVADNPRDKQEVVVTI